MRQISKWDQMKKENYKRLVFQYCGGLSCHSNDLQAKCCQGRNIKSGCFKSTNEEVLFNTTSLNQFIKYTD